MSNSLIGIIIVSAGDEASLRRLLDSLDRQSYPHREIVVIDNASLLTVQTLKKEYPHVVIYPGTGDRLYCQALNQGIAASRGDFILCLNDDVILHDTFLERALEGFCVSPDVGMVSGKILRIDAKTIDSTGLFLSVWRSPRERGYGVPDEGQFEKPGYVFGVNGAVAFYRRLMLEQIRLKGGYFDPDFGIFYEDLDLAWRAQNSGWKAYYIPSAIAYHVRGATVRKGRGIDMPAARRYLSDPLYARLFKNRYYTIVRNESAGGLLVHFPFMVLYDAAVFLHFLLTRPALALKAVFTLNPLRIFLHKLGEIASERRKSYRKIPA